MSQDWPSFDFSSGADTVKEAIEGLRDRTNDLRTSNNGSSAPSTDLRFGMLWWNTNTDELKILTVISPPTWKTVPVEGTNQLDDTWLLTDAVTTTKILDGAVTGDKLGTSAVLTAKINALAVTAAKLAVDAVETAKIKDAAVTAPKILDAAVTTAKILDANVTTPKIADDAVTADKIGPEAVETAGIKDGAVTAAKLDSAASLQWNLVAKSSNYTATSGDFVAATVGTSWTLDLPAAPSINNRVGVYASGVTTNQTLTIDGGTKSIGQQGTTLLLYIPGDRVELIYDGTQWVVVGGQVHTHICTLEKTGMTRSAPGTSFLAIGYDNEILDRGKMANTGSNRIDIRRTGNYRIRLQALFGQVGPTGWIFRMLKNGAALSPRMTYLNVSDAYQDGTLDSVGPDWTREYYLTAGDYIQADYYYYLYASGDNSSRLTVEELPVII